MEIEYFAPLEPGTYSIDPDVEPSTPLRVVYEIPAEGWERWIGAAKFSDAGHVGVSITTVSNLVRHGCRNQSWADPPVGPSVDDLAAALADLAPFRVTYPPQDVSIYEYRGMHLELSVPDLPFEGEGDDGLFVGCPDGDLKSWGRGHRHGTGRRVLRLHRSRLHGGDLDPRRRRHPPDDRGRPVPRISNRGPRGAARDPGLPPDRALTPSRAASAGDMGEVRGQPLVERANDPTYTLGRPDSLTF
jgi:hypothetical protein